MKDWKFIINKWVLRRGPRTFYESRVKRRLKKLRGNVFVDIGANQGIYSIALSRNFREVYAFEPNPKMIVVLRERIAMNNVPNIKVLPIALADRIGRATLYLDPHEGFSGSTDTILPHFEYKPVFIPEGGSPQSYVGRNGVDVEISTYDATIKIPADLVKIDVEGAEFLVLKGMKESIQNRRVRNILVELHNRDRKEELEGLLRDFTVEWVDPDHLLASLQ